MQKKHFLLVALIALLVLTSCGTMSAEQVQAVRTADAQAYAATQEAVNRNLEVSALQTQIAEMKNAVAPTTTPPAPVQEQTEEVAPPTSTTAPAANLDDPLTPSLMALGFNNREELISFFSMVGVEPREIATCPGELKCVRVLREKNADNFILPFEMTNPTSTRFDGWMAEVSRKAVGDLAKPGIPNGGPWQVEGITIRPWR